MNFDEYLRSKKIDSRAFQASESELWEAWKKEFEALHPASFTAQKLYLINPIRRKYQATQETPPVASPALTTTEEGVKSQPAPGPTAQSPKPVVARPVVRPKPKMN